MSNRNTSRNIKNTLPPPAPKPGAPIKNIAGQFADLPFDEKVSAFKEIKAQMRNGFEEQFKKQEERAVYLKDNFEGLIG